MTDIKEVRTYAAELLVELDAHVADPAGVTDVLAGWHSELGSRLFGVVCAAALQSAFGECMSVVQPTEVPPGSTVYGRNVA